MVMVIYTPLHFSAELGYSDIISLLICHNAEVNVRSNSDYEETPLHVACRNSYQSAQVLITHGADVSAKDTEGEEALHDASRHNNHKVIELLLMVNADINATCKIGYTALHVTCSSEEVCENAAETLIRHGIDINMKDNDEKQALDLADENGFTGLSKLIANAQSQKLMSDEFIDDNFEKEKKDLDVQLLNIKKRKVSLIINRKRKSYELHLYKLQGMKQKVNETNKRIKETRLHLRQLENQCELEGECLTEMTNHCVSISTEMLALNRAKTLLKIDNIEKESDYDCPVCLEMPLPPRLVFQCAEGHIYCSSCKEKSHMDLCPQCRMPIKNLSIRCRFMENMIKAKFCY